MRRAIGCTCFDELEKQLGRIYPDPEGKLLVEQVLFPFRPEGDQVLPVFNYRYRKPRGANRGFTKTRYLKAVVFEFCPFCGRKYERGGTSLVGKRRPPGGTP